MRARPKSTKPTQTAPDAPDLAVVVHEMLHHIDALRIHLEDLAAMLGAPKKRAPKAKAPRPRAAAANGNARPRPRALQ
ncbi:MAG: hypothetical protein HOO96_12445 [Polyangiaceae bacterium]|nr:hypothetical protein [Polyangiaceae bacterium]